MTDEPAGAEPPVPPVPPVSAAEFKRAVGRFATGVVVLTVLDSLDEELGTRDDLGMTATAFTSVSVEPPLVLVGVSADSYLTEVLERQDRWAVTLLAHAQKQIAGRFAMPGRPSARILLGGVAHHRGACTGAMIPEGGLAALECATHQRVYAGDHMLVIGEVLGVDYVSGSETAPERAPAALVHYGRHYHRLAGS